MEKTFILKSLGLSETGVDCKYTVKEVGEILNEEQEYHVKTSRPVHPDLRKLFETDLADIASKIIGIEGLSAMRVSFAGQGDNIGVSIAGKIDTRHGAATFKTPRIKYRITDSEVAALLTVFAESLTKEIEAYLFEDKSADMEVFGE